ncbi:putative nucleotidyltransferase [Angulomicrobium tetraedrale]|uniref:Putative nucleotidyltransferase n=1 Tax=Ancylobacter tetraedralis TaxID=217068 RepID=A0A839ZHG7_9HYPH|nr:putative nucleotidyltransferase [Ancylobacter tetraedralis]
MTNLQCQEDVTLLLAAESGSRAWGFASPDSDYDCRFIFIRHLEHYLCLSPPRDVIELPSDGVFDINGWDLAKTLKLMLKGNVTALEWLQSPINYAGSGQFRNELLAFANAMQAATWLHVIICTSVSGSGGAISAMVHRFR